MNLESFKTLINEDVERLSFLYSNLNYEPIAYKDYTLIMPAVSVGNVGQLTIDLLLANLKNIEKVTSIIDNSVLPVVGRDKHGLCSCLEVFVCRDEKIVLLQQRAPFVKGRIPRFRKRLLNWFRESSFHSIIMMGSTSSHIRKDKDIGGSPIRYLSATTYLQKKVESVGLWEPYTIKKGDSLDEYFLPGSGIIKSLHEECCEEKLPFLTFLVFCHPGDNSSEAILLVENLKTYLELSIEEKLQIPLTWKPSSMKFEAGYVF